jgi:hypothetical protein
MSLEASGLLLMAGPRAVDPEAAAFVGPALGIGARTCRWGLGNVGPGGIAIRARFVVVRHRRVARTAHVRSGSERGAWHDRHTPPAVDGRSRPGGTSVQPQRQQLPAPLAIGAAMWRLRMRSALLRRAVRVRGRHGIRGRLGDRRRRRA